MHDVVLQYFKDDVDVVSKRVQVLEGQFQRDSVGVEEGAGLKYEADFNHMSSVFCLHPCHTHRWFDCMGIT